MEKLNKKISSMEPRKVFAKHTRNNVFWHYTQKIKSKIQSRWKKDKKFQQKKKNSKKKQKRNNGEDTKKRWKENKEN